MMRSGEQRIRDDLGLEFLFDDARQVLDVRWDPAPPRRLSAEELMRYRQLRNEFLRKVAAEIGGSVVVIEP